MPALNFNDQFVEAVESGKKPNTIRAMRKRPFKVGDRLYHYNRMRRPECRKLGESDAEIVQGIEILRTALGVCFVYISETPNCDEETEQLSYFETAKLAERDGFRNIEEFYEWFIPKGEKDYFSGQLIAWPNTWLPASECN